ncbi:MAG TPA: adenylosuccinate synthase [Candidatus Excrementavichristensenella intestinipullorum]|nr:adenylosuccinate synthase [Candidatus Excrementavichristensenella intestinipullorum]
MNTCAIVGINWGDEGKGRMVDYLAAQYDVVVRYQGGNNAGHTVINQYGKFALNLLPSGIFRPETMNLLGVGTVVDPQHLTGEIARVREQGVQIGPDNLKIADRAIIVFPFYPLQDQMEEARLGSQKFGSTRRGISPAYGDKYMKKAIQMGDLLHPQALEKHLRLLVDWKNAVFSKAYGQPPIQFDQVMQWLEQYAMPLKPYICDAGQLLKEALSQGKSILFEAQLGALRDIEYGIYPYSSSSSPLAAYAPLGCGLPSIKVREVVGVAKAYSTCVGEGPFVGELMDAKGDWLREAGGEYGAATGRPRRVGWLDLVATRYGVQLQGATALALTKLDVLTGLKEIPVCAHYRTAQGKVTDTFPFTPELYGCQPVYEVLPGWEEDISGVRRFQDLPKAAQDYVLYCQEKLGCPIKYVSVGADREQLIIR